MTMCHRQQRRGRGRTRGRRLGQAAAGLAVGVTTALCGAGAAVPAGAAGIASSAGPPVRVGSAPSLGAGAQLLGPLPAATRLQVDVALEPRDPAALARFATEVSTPGSALYRHYLARGQFGPRFGAPLRALRRVEADLRSRGLDPGPVPSDRLFVPVTASAGALEHALGLSIDRVRLASGRLAFANLEPPSFDRSVAAAVAGVIGLDDLTVARPLGLARLGRAVRLPPSPQVVTGGPQPCSTAVSDAPSQDAYTADQLASAYRFSSLYGAGDEGAGVTVALFELEPNLPGDITAYQSCYGTSATVNYEKEDGFKSTGAGSGEAALDIEDVIGLAPKATIDVYEAPNSNTGLIDDYTAIADNESAEVVSTSWGECEADSSSTIVSEEETLFAQMASQGQSMLAAAGDDGSEDCGGNALGVDDPGSDPWVTSVGGTKITALGPPPTETVWNESAGGDGAGGGGISEKWGMPSYQADAPSTLHVVNSYSSGTPCKAASGSYCREVPDVSTDADPYSGYLIYYDGAWTGIGGTSAAAPLWAAFTALTDASSECASKPVGFLNPDLYDLAGGSAYPLDFQDVTSGNNDYTKTNDGKYPAGVGYDMASGLGTPDAAGLAPGLCELSSPTTVSVTNPGTTTSPVGLATSLQVDATDSDSALALTYAAAGLPAGLSISATTGLVSGTPSSTGTYPVTVTVTDSSGSHGSVSFNWDVVPVVTVTSPGAQSSVVGVPVSLQLSGTDANPHGTLTWSANGLPNGLELSPSTGLVTGSPLSAGEYSTTIAATDSAGASAQVSFDWTVAPAISLADPGDQVTAAGTPVTLDLEASDADAGTTLSYSASGLPPGLGLDAATGAISGAPTVAGTYPVSVGAADGDGNTASASFTWTVDDVVSITNPGAQSTTAGSEVDLQIAATDAEPSGVPTYSASGLPPGLAIGASTGAVTGTPTTDGQYSVTITASDGLGVEGQVEFEWTVASVVTVTSPGAQSFDLGAPVSLSVSATDSDSTATLTFAGSGLPAGVTLSPSTGALSGTPTAAGSGTATVTVTDGPGATGQTTFSWTVTGASISGVVTDGTHPDGLKGVCVSATGPSGSGSAVTAGNGSYTIGGLEPGTYVVEFDPTCAGTVTSSDLAQWWDDAATAAKADGVTVAAAGAAPAIDADLVPKVAPTTTTGSVSSPSVTVGTTVTFSAKVSSSYGTPNGRVTFDDGTKKLCSASLKAGTASCTSAGETVGTTSVTAKYGGSKKFAASSASIDLTVTKATTSTAASPGTAAAVVGARVTFEVRVTSHVGRPSGTVGVYLGSRRLCAAVLSDGSGSCSSRALSTAGVHHLVARYLGGTKWRRSSCSFKVTTEQKGSVTRRQERLGVRAAPGQAAGRREAVRSA